MDYIIPLSNGKGRMIVDEGSYEYLSQFTWSLSHYGYAVRRGRKSLGENVQQIVYAHREIINAEKGMDVDHINGDRTDNRKSNLRLCTRSQNLQNMGSKPGTSSYKGVSWAKDRQKWRVSLRVNNKNINVGDFENEEEAALAYNVAASRAYGEYARLNVVTVAKEGDK